MPTDIILIVVVYLVRYNYICGVKTYLTKTNAFYQASTYPQVGAFSLKNPRVLDALSSNLVFVAG